MAIPLLAGLFRPSTDSPRDLVERVQKVERSLEAVAQTLDESEEALEVARKALAEVRRLRVEWEGQAEVLARHVARTRRLAKTADPEPSEGSEVAPEGKSVRRLTRKMRVMMARGGQT